MTLSKLIEHNRQGIPNEKDILTNETLNIGSANEFENILFTISTHLVDKGNAHSPPGKNSQPGFSSESVQQNPYPSSQQYPSFDTDRLQKKHY